MAEPAVGDQLRAADEACIGCELVVHIVFETRRVVMAQDTGSAITGAVRVDYFWGWGDTAEQQAGRMKQPLRVWVLAPRN